MPYYKYKRKSFDYIWQVSDIINYVKYRFGIKIGRQRVNDWCDRKGLRSRKLASQRIFWQTDVINFFDHLPPDDYLKASLKKEKEKFNEIRRSVNKKIEAL